ncbi:hypothetical protein QFC19_004471 [Naganishia cerealis]|uniref:Uncharacterized protein n=1 Tax=Naganishia cerealis TaxID=610337 RepID=A0ACC2VVL0_9TREE|nr:hypothetical protein QFC19_004471 [Naganishia cerealis]
MNSCFNRRIAYYKALQGISDTVAELDLETDDVAKDLERINLRIVTAEAAYDKVNARRRYLDRLIRQLRFWRETEPEVKHIIFSSWKDALSIVEAALNANNISWRSRTDKKDDKSVQEFTEDPDIHVFLLHGERENSGLTLTAASVCHLLEPVINSGFELQGKNM